MEMQMRNRLTGIIAAVGNDAESGIQLFLRSDLCNRRKNPADDLCILFRNCRSTGDMLLRNKEIMQRRNRIDILECVNIFIFIDLCIC